VTAATSSPVSPGEEIRTLRTNAPNIGYKSDIHDRFNSGLLHDLAHIWHALENVASDLKRYFAPPGGLEPPTLRLTAECSAN
jgi:hypothetical protein